MDNGNLWMKDSIGLSFHWTTYTTLLGGKHLSFQEAVAGFDVDRFCDDIIASGATHIIFTLAHACEYLPLPCEPLESLLPGRTTERDLVGEIIAKLEKHDIKFIAYYNHACNGTCDMPWRVASGYDAGINGDLDAFAEHICDIVEFIAKRYGTHLAGWWFDSAYSVDKRGPSNTVTCEMGDWLFPWDKLVDAAKAGYAECPITINAGIGRTFLYSDRQEYYAGETYRIDQEFAEITDPDMIDHRWMCLDNNEWVYFARDGKGFAEPRYSDDEICAFIAEHHGNGRMVTFNVEIDQSGLINPMALKQFTNTVSRFKK